MAVTLADRMKSTFYDFVLDPAKFPNVEIGTFRRDGKPDRQVYAKVSADDRFEQGQIVDREVQQILALVGKDESHARGGISKPMRGDKWIRPGDQKGEPYWAFTGVVSGITAHSWQLTFERSTPSYLGNRGIR